MFHIIRAMGMFNLLSKVGLYESQPDDLNRILRYATIAKEHRNG